MILLSNVKITNTPLWCNYNRGNLPKKPDRLDIWKYSISSYVPMLPLISKVVLFVDISEYSGQEDITEEYLRKLFPEDKLILFWKRNVTQHDWQESCNQIIFPIDDNLIFNLTNDDHLFLDNNIDLMAEGLKLLNNHEDHRTVFEYSHWPEGISRASERGWNRKGDSNFIEGHGYRSIQSIDICKKERWNDYWFKTSLGNEPIYYRPEFIQHNTALYQEGHPVLIPLKEQVRHFDGYSHINMDLNVCPPLDIPIGFFEKNIKIRYGYDEIKDGYVNINPSAQNLLAAHPEGHEYKFSLEDLPIFWKHYISEIDINPNVDLEKLREYRDQHYYRCATILRENAYPVPFFKNHYISQEWKLKD